MLFVIDARPEPVRARRNEAAKARFLEALAAMRASALAAARALVELDRDGHFVFDGCASIGEFGERHGAAAPETRELLSLGRALEACPELEEHVRAGRVPLRAAALIGRVVAEPSFLRPGDDWLGWATSESTKELRRRVDRRVEESRRGTDDVEPVTVFLSPEGRDDLRRARSIASRKAERALTEGETVETAVDHYLRTFDPARRAAGSRRLPHTSTVAGRYVPRAVERTLRDRDGDRC